MLLLVLQSQMSRVYSVRSMAFAGDGDLLRQLALQNNSDLTQIYKRVRPVTGSYFFETTARKVSGNRIYKSGPLSFSVKNMDSSYSEILLSEATPICLPMLSYVITMVIMDQHNVLSDLMEDTCIRLLFVHVVNIPIVIWIPPHIAISLLWVVLMAVFTTLCVVGGYCECRVFYDMF